MKECGGGGDLENIVDKDENLNPPTYFLPELPDIIFEKQILLIQRKTF